ncbi:LysM peptidoglycan-binding domain-containing protein [Shivajiella indica]|uniref:LysM peptidoglycan-binding domain-containing protein n=1 Tax=Shivajiella indica TaxID=872115 RepID=A0ABW5B966_9BACT
MKNLIVFCLGLFTILNVSAAEITPMDSVGIEKVGDKTFIIHQVDQGETLFGISRRYQTAINDIIQNNEALQAGLKIGQRIRIPYISKAALPEGAKLHKVAPGETLFSISKLYGATVDDVKGWNNLQGNDLSVGQALVIQNAVVQNPPTPTPTVKESVAATVEPTQEKTVPVKPAVPATAKEEVKASTPKVATPAPVTSPASSTSTGSKALPGEWITHTVSQGETLFSVAQKYEAKVEDLIAWNSLSSNNLSIGQKLKVGREIADPAKVPVVTSSVPVLINNDKTEGQLTTTRPEVGTGESTAYKNIKETGLAEVIEGTGNHKKYLVLHRTAPVGTIMRVRNEENDITIFARVVGKLPETGDNGRLVIKVSKAAYDQLRAVNARFRVEISY